jgi:hypothetical protein
MRTEVAMCILSAASLLASPVWAGRPLATEDAGVLGQGECEIESFAGHFKDRSSPSATAFWAQYGCGFGGATQLAFGAGTEKSSGELTKVAALTGKTFLRELTDEQAGFTLAYTLLGAQVPSSNFKYEASELKGALTMPHDGWLLHANLGTHYAHQSRQYSSIWALAVERPGALGPVDLMAEIFGDDRSATWMQVAARWTVVPKRFFLDTSWGVQADSARAKQLTIGLKVAF